MVQTELDPFILAVAGIAVILLAGLLISINRLISSNKKVQENQQNQNNLLLNIANVLSSNTTAQLSRQEVKQSEKAAEQSAE
jgi:type II secretory pathway pseudopilin PulG